MKSKSPKPSRKAATSTAKKSEADGRVAKYLTTPHGSAAATLHSVLRAVLPKNPEFLPDVIMVRDELEANSLEAKNGNLTSVESTLATQATVLDFMFNQVAQIACGHSLDSGSFERIFRLALRAQAQSARTLEILANIKQGPRVVFAQQLNSAHQQIVNNAGSPADAAPSRIVRSAQNGNPPPTSHALENTPSIQTNAPMDPRSPRETTPVYPPMAAMDQVNRPQQRRRKAEKQP